MNARLPRPSLPIFLILLALPLLWGCTSGKRPGYGAPDPVYGVTDRETAARPLDPLTAREREAALQAALADPRVREVLGGQPHRVVAIDFVADKGPSSEVVRSAEVFLYRPDRDVGVRALVHLQEAAVVAVAPVSGTQVPLTQEDYQLAHELALASPEVQSRLGPGLREAVIEVLRELPNDAEDPCFRHRCVFLLFRLPEGYAVVPRVVVDLTERAVHVQGEKP